MLLAQHASLLQTSSERLLQNYKKPLDNLNRRNKTKNIMGAIMHPTRGYSFQATKAVDLFIFKNIIQSQHNYSFNNALADVGYSQRYIQSSGTALWNRQEIQREVQRAIDQKKAKSELQYEVTIDKIKAKCQHLYDLCIAANDRSTAAACIRLEGQTIAAFTDKFNFGELEKGKEITEAMREQAEKIATILIQERVTTRTRTVKIEKRPESDEVKQLP